MLYTAVTLFIDYSGCMLQCKELKIKTWHNFFFFCPTHVVLCFSPSFVPCVFSAPSLAFILKKKKTKEETWKQNISNILNKFDTRTTYSVSEHEWCYSPLNYFNADRKSISTTSKTWFLFIRTLMINTENS